MPVRDLLSAASGTGGATDPYFYDVSLLLNGDGTNGAQNNTFLDSSTNNFTITRNGNTTQGSFSPYGTLWSNYFVGTSGSSASPNYLATPSSSVWAFGTGAFTLECWGYLTSAPDVANGWNFFDFRTGTSLTVGWQNDQMFTYDGTTTITSSSVSSYLNKWTHWAWMRSGSTVYLFANGVVIGSGSMSTNFGTSASVCTINARYSGVQSAGGFFSNARVSNIARYATTGFTPATTNFTNDANTLLLTMQNNRFIDNSSNAFTLTVNGTPSVQRFSPFNPTAPYSTSVIGGSGYFDGSSSYLTSPSNSAYTLGATGDFTVECWAYLNGTQGTSAPVLLTNYVDWNTGYLTYWILQIRNGNQLNWLDSAGNNAIAASSTTAIAPNTWNHIAVVRSGTTITMYINGLSVGTYTGANQVYTGTNTLSMGYVSSANYINGYISNARIVKGTAVYTSTFTPPTVPLSAITNTSFLTNMVNAGIPDLAMQNNLQTVGDAQISTSVKKYGTGSLKFDGTGDWLSIPNTPNLQLNAGAFTIECWINFSSLASNRGIMYFGTNPNSNFAYGLQWAGNALYFWYTTTGSNLASVSASWTPSTSVWYFLAVTRSGNDLKFFIDGTQIGTTQSLSGVTIFNSTDVILIGGEATGSPNSLPGTMNGYIDDMRITKGLARYTTTFTPPTSALPTY